MALVQKSVKDGAVGTITLDNLPNANGVVSAFIADLLEALAWLGGFGGSRGRAAGVAGREGLVSGARRAGTADRWPRSTDLPRPAAAGNARDQGNGDAGPRDGRGERLGGACELVMSCDVVVAAEGVTFALTPAKLGVPYDIAGVLNFMRSVSLPVIKEMLFTAQPMPAERALRVGIVDQVVPADRLEGTTAELAGADDPEFAAGRSRC